jgi:hypothetical protein
MNKHDTLWRELQSADTYGPDVLVFVIACIAIVYTLMVLA